VQGEDTGKSRCFLCRYRIPQPAHSSQDCSWCLDNTFSCLEEKVLFDRFNLKISDWREIQTLPRSFFSML
jgi:hypothetical protein